MRKLLCKLFGHRLVNVNQFGFNFFKCTRCGWYSCNIEAFFNYSMTKARESINEELERSFNELDKEKPHQI